MKAFLVSVVACTLSLHSPAFASAWGVKAEDDLFSDKKKVTLQAYVSSNARIYAECVDGHPELALLLRENWGESLEVVPVDFVFRVDAGPRQSREAKFYEHNDRFIGAKVTGERNVAAILDSFAKARSSILVGLEAAGGNYRVSESVPVSGSAKAVKAYFKACNIDPEVLFPKTDGPPLWFPSNDPWTSGAQK